MHYRWKNAPLESLFDAIRSEKLHYDSWLLITCDEVASDSSTHPPLVSLWFSSLEETVHYIEERLVPLWISPTEKELRTELLAASSKLLATRRLTPKVINDWRTQFNRKMVGKVQLRWLGLIDDLIRAEDPVIEEISDDLEFWLGDNGVELTDLDLETPKHQRLTIEFLVQLGS